MSPTIGSIPGATTARTKSEDFTAKNRPFTGQEYLESLRDGREIYIYGDKVKDVTVHPAFRNAAISLMRVMGASNIAAACRRYAAQPALALAAVGLDLRE